MRNLFIFSALLIMACGPAVVATNTVDPCAPITYNELLCQQAIAQQGFYTPQHVFVHHVYVQPFSYYRGGYNTYIYRRRTTVIVPHTTVVVPRTRSYVRPVPRTYYRYRSRR